MQATFRGFRDRFFISAKLYHLIFRWAAVCSSFMKNEISVYDDVTTVSPMLLQVWFSWYGWLHGFLLPLSQHHVPPSGKCTKFEGDDSGGLFLLGPLYCSTCTPLLEFLNKLSRIGFQFLKWQEPALRSLFSEPYPDQWYDTCNVKYHQNHHITGVYSPN
jgi:hypothetical protein